MNFIPSGDWKKYLKKIVKHAPYDAFFSVMPYIVDFWKNINVDIFCDAIFVLCSGDVLTDYTRNLIVKKGEQFGKLAYPVDIYGSSEVVWLGAEIPPNLVKELQYIAETHVALIRKENGELINILDAKPGDRGEIVITPLFEYTVPNYLLHDIIEVTSDETMFGLPAYKILGRQGQRVDLELETLGRIKGIYSVLLRVKGININGLAYTNLLGKNFNTDHFTVVIDKLDKVIMRTYVETHVDKETLIEKIKEDKEISYLYDDIKNELLEIDLIYDPEVVKEVKEKVYSRYGPQANIPRIVLIEAE